MAPAGPNRARIRRWKLPSHVSERPTAGATVRSRMATRVTTCGVRLLSTLPPLILFPGQSPNQVFPPRTASFLEGSLFPRLLRFPDHKASSVRASAGKPPKLVSRQTSAPAANPRAAPLPFPPGCFCGIADPTRGFGSFGFHGLTNVFAGFIVQLQTAFEPLFLQSSKRDSSPLRTRPGTTSPMFFSPFKGTMLRFGLESRH